MEFCQTINWSNKELVFKSGPKLDTILREKHDFLRPVLDQFLLSGDGGIQGKEKMYSKQDVFFVLLKFAPSSCYTQQRFGKKKCDHTES